MKCIELILCNHVCIFIFIVLFLPCDCECIRTVLLSTSVCLSVCLSLRPYVKRVHCDKTNILPNFLYHSSYQKTRQVGQLSQTNRAAAYVSSGKNISAKSVRSNIALSYGAKDISKC